jgi:hypothetical protein
MSRNKVSRARKNLGENIREQKQSARSKERT